MKSSTLILVGLTLCSLYITHASGISPGATGTFSLALVTLTGHLPTVLSGVLTLTSQGIQYLNNEQFAAMQDPYAPGGSGTPGQGLWRDDGNGGGRGGSAPAQDYEDDEDKSEPDQEDEEVEEKEDDDESEEKEIVDDAPVESEEVKEVVKVKAPKKYKTPKKVSKDQIEALKEKEAIQKLKEQSEEVVDDDLEIDADDADAEGEEKRRKQPPMPPVLSQQLMMSQYDAAINGVQPEGANAPLLSRMTSYLSSLLGRGGQSQYGSDQYGSNPYFVNRDAKSIESEDIITESNEPDTSSRTKRDVDVLSRRNRQLKLAEVSLHPFYHVRDNIRTMVRRQPTSKLTSQPVDDFSNLSEKASKPIKLFMEPYSAPQTYQNPPINPAQGVRGPSSGGGLSNPGGLGSPTGLGQTASQQSSPSNSGGGKQQGSSGGNKKNNNNNKQSNNKGSDKDSEEDDSDENDSEQDQNYIEEDDYSNGIDSGEGDGGLDQDDVEEGDEEDDEYDEDYK